MSGQTIRSVWPLMRFRYEKLRSLSLLVVVLLVILGAAQRSEAASAAVINAEVDATFHSFVEQIGGARELANKAAGILVFPMLKPEWDLVANMARDCCLSTRDRLAITT
jgi:hypothetical protein